MGLLDAQWRPQFRTAQIPSKTAATQLADRADGIDNLQAIGLLGASAALPASGLLGRLALGAQLAMEAPDANAMFIGKAARTWDKVSHEAAKRLAALGVDPRKIWSDTGNWKGPDGHWRQEIPDNLAQWSPTPGFLTGKELALQHEVMPHGQLSSAYPSTGDIVVKRMDDEGGQYGNVDINDRITSEDIGIGSHAVKPVALGYRVDNDLAKSTNLHELQHAIQHREGFARGGSPSNAPYFADQAKKETLDPLYRSKRLYDSLSDEAGDLSRVNYLKKLESLGKKQNIKPSDITNMSAWYEYSDDIRQWMGPMPKKAGSSRDNWLRGAADRILYHEKAKTEIPAYQLDGLLSRDTKDLKNEYARIDRKRAKYRDEARQYSEAERKFDEIGKLSPYEQYRRLAGEAEARATQSRMNLNAEERRALFPEDSYDVPLDQLIIRGLLNP